jgi:hypothetical protein
VIFWFRKASPAPARASVPQKKGARRMPWRFHLKASQFLIPGTIPRIANRYHKSIHRFSDAFGTEKPPPALRERPCRGERAPVPCLGVATPKDFSYQENFSILCKAMPQSIHAFPTLFVQKSLLQPCKSVRVAEKGRPVDSMAFNPRATDCFAAADGGTLKVSFGSTSTCFFVGMSVF